MDAGAGVPPNGALIIVIERKMSGRVIAHHTATEAPKSCPMTPATDARRETLHAYLGELRDLLYSKRLERLVLLLRDGVRADVRRSHRLKFWRRDDAVLA